MMDLFALVRHLTGYLPLAYHVTNKNTYVITDEKFLDQNLKAITLFPIISSMESEKMDDLDGLHRLPGTDDQQEGGLIIKKKTQAASSDDQHIFKVPQLPPSTSSFGLDRLAAEKRRVQSSTSSSKRSKASSFDEMDDEDNDSHTNKSRHLREQRVETPSSSRSSHHDVYDKSRPVPKPMQRGLAYGKEGHKQRMLKDFIHFLIIILFNCRAKC
jgi:hypothetical protein